MHAREDRRTITVAPEKKSRRGEMGGSMGQGSKENGKRL